MISDKEDAVISDELNHASIIDGVRLCKAKRYRYKHCDMADLEKILIETKGDQHHAIYLFYPLSLSMYFG
ncbi:unnamed protein product [Anisakis simplex]|uniref:2-amino-3-ketobutyrate coenzyme A ligase, mitochondrial (inferred by orthology to a human protein) n=1 Tax=Anisakis simplex TaxID=6269 RepID=A0A0M3JP82_ANISI|nr:unnamed protein product [Anisakis simplex]